MNRSRRFLVFSFVGVCGIGVQLLALSLLTLAGMHYIPATAAAVTLALLHNFVWHRLWTWRDRRSGGMATFVRFVVANGVVSVAGNLCVMIVLVGGADVNPVAANIVAVAVCGLLNFWLGDAHVF